MEAWSQPAALVRRLRLIVDPSGPPGTTNKKNGAPGFTDAEVGVDSQLKKLGLSRRSNSSLRRSAPAGKLTTI